MLLFRPLASALLLPMLLAAAAASHGCAPVQQTAGEAPDGVTARQLYFAGMRSLVRGDYERAVGRFTELARFPRFMRFAALGKLRLADTLYFQERYIEALEVYEEFVALYPQDPNVPYARFMAARALHDRMPGDVAFFSPAGQLDQSRVLQARDRLQAFISEAPGSPLAFDAAMLLREVRRRLYEHHETVAAFYRKRKKPRAEAGRLMEMLVGYPEWGSEPAALKRLVRLLRDDERASWKDEALSQLAVRYPGSTPSAAGSTPGAGPDTSNPPAPEGRPEIEEEQ